MANLNLSEFTEKLFVADADHTFIWDSAESISKRVSRNSWLNSGTLTSDAPVTISQTWGAVGQTFTAFKVNAAGTSDANSAAGSLLADFQVNGVSKALIAKSGVLVANTFALGGDYPVGITRIGDGGLRFIRSNVAGAGFSGIAPILDVAYDGIDFFLNLVNVAATLRFGSDTRLQRDGAPNTLALRNGANTQTFNVYGSYGSISDYKRLSISCDQTTGNATITNQAAGYTAGTVSINGVPVGRGKQNLSDNIGIGFSTLNSTSSGNYNTALGYSALQNGSGQDFNVAVGNYTLFNNNGDNNVAIGIQALWQKTTGARDTAIGSFAGAFFTGGSPNNNLVSNDSVFIGADTKPLASGETNQIVIGYNATGIGSNSVVLGNDSITKTALKGNVGIGTTSPTSKLQVSAGDVEVDTIAKGVILKSPDGTRYRVTVANGGTLSVAAV